MQSVLPSVKFDTTVRPGKTPPGGVRLRRIVRALVFACILAGSVPSAPAATAPDELLRQIRSTVLDIDDSVLLKSLELEMGPATLEVERGILVPAKTEDGMTVELVFIGQARFKLEAPDEIEAGQLELFTGGRGLEAPVEEAVLVLANRDVVGDLLGRPAPRELRSELVERAEEIHRRWLDDAQRRRSGVESAIFKFLVGDVAFRHYFALWCNSFELGEFVYQLDPEDMEPVTLASFKRLDLTSWERTRLRHQIRVQQRKGHFLDVRVQDLGSWDIWLSSDWSPPDGASLPGSVGFETEHYELDVTIKRRKLLLEGEARLDLSVQASGRRVVKLDLMSDLVVREIVDGDGRPMFHFRSGDEVVVLLPEPSRAGDRISLHVTYGGRALQWVRGRIYDLKQTDGWYPHCGTVDRATYDVTLRWPRGRQVVAGGRLVDEGRDGNYRWERRLLDVPSIAFSFVLGDFIVDRTRIGHVDVTIAFSRIGNMRLTRELRDRVAEAVGDSLEYFEEVFGPYPLDELTLVTVPRQFSQSYLGFVTLAESVIRHRDPLSESASWQRETTIAHELAHQWWGNLVGWWSYRDQWLSEGMANYSALLYDGFKSGEGSNRLAVMSSGWRDSLSQTTLEGRTIESLGPIVLGNRLNSSRARNAYRTIVYRKGAVVLAMLARAVGEERFQQMLNSLVRVASHRVLTTELFVKSLERMSGLELEGFARQFIYGTGIPEVYYSYDTAPGGDGGWTVQGEARLRAEPYFRYEIVQRDDESWDVERLPGAVAGEGPTTLMVPYRVTLDEAEQDPSLRLSTGKLGSYQNGRLILNGREDGFEIATASRPVDLKLDPRGEILAWFFSEERHPKRVLRYQAARMAASGQLEQAEERYEEALGLEALPAQGSIDPLRPPSPTPRIDGPREDLRIRLELVRVYVEQQRWDRAVSALDEIEEKLARSDSMSFRVERDTLRSRMEIHGGDYATAHRRLKKTLKLAAPGRDRSWRDLLVQLQLTSERLALTEAYALLAVAAHETGNDEDLDWAIKEARNRGADVTALRLARRSDGSPAVDEAAAFGLIGTP